MITINPKDRRPIYEQIKGDVKKLIHLNILAPGDNLPSVRSLASELRINPNTIQRAYSELESEGFIISRAGKGSFVSDKSSVQNANLNALKSELESNVKMLLEAGETQSNIEKIVKGIFEKENKTHD